MLAPFSRVHAAFVSSSALVMLFPMISAPLVARLYTPEDFGVYAVFFALATIFSTASSLELRNIAFLEAERVDGAHGAILGICIVTLFTTTLFAALFILPGSWFAEIFGSQVTPYILWLPFTVFLMGSFQVLYAWTTREKEFKILARNKLILGLTTMVLQIGIGAMQPGPIGFIISNVIGQAIAVILLLILFVKKLIVLRPEFSVKSAVAQLRKHYRLTVWTMPGALINSLSQFLPELLINRLYGAALLGQYSLAVRMINLPIAFVASSIQDFFRQQAADEFDKLGHCNGSFWRFFALSILCSLFVILPIVVFIPYVFPVIFGSQWNDSGAMIQALSCLVIIRFISSPLSYIWIIRGQEHLDFFWQNGLLLISFVSLLAPVYFVPETSIFTTLWIYAVSVSLWYCIALLVSHKLSKNVKA